MVRFFKLAALLLLAPACAAQPLAFNVDGDLPASVIEGAAFWGLDAYPINQRDGAITVVLESDDLDGVRGHAFGPRSHPRIEFRDADPHPLVVAHEIGHVAGLGHSDDPENLMHETVDFETAFVTDKQVAVVERMSWQLELYQ